GKDCEFDLLVSSPPYGDNKTTIPYGQHAYLPLQWIDLNDIDHKVSEDLLRTTLEIDSRSLGGKIKKFSTAEMDFILAKSPTLKKTIKRLSQNHSAKIKKVLSFIFDFDKSLELIVKSVKTNGYFIWTIGNRNVGETTIQNDKILIDLMSRRGAKLVKTINRKILNKRMALRNDSSTTMNKEKILIFRKSATI
ncbi:MAG: site-specific DNA-methyltransferase, partial [Bacteroidia bacterium]|nr:site-specific DNA-methyltransferase [Bacteroidia bacterium]